MSHASLTTRYRPQTFADLAGQSTLKAILSRAVAESRVAPAYLFSGTRGVGKTTIARIFAKALNCRNPISVGSGTEPCNQCDQCRAVTMGSSVDVVEIDGASNRGIDDVRKLKESVGYAPMEGRYKIFIIDEAHMLSREAFNALLKTLEEPPARVTFIMATTEPHKFPITIISRCQHYVFKRLSDIELEAHLKKVLGSEKQPYEDAALRLIVRRAAGSVRDAMSLLGQVLALGGETLAESDTRAVLGLAGQELFFRILAAVKASDCAGLSLLVRDMLDQGVDLGFFLRELTAMWRNLFMLRQVGKEALALVELPEAEALRWHDEAQDMQVSHIHACWQLTLEGQRRVLTSLEPAMALELLLLNLAMLPRLIPLDQFSNLSRKASASQSAQQPQQTAEAEKKSPLTRDSFSGSHNASSQTAPAAALHASHSLAPQSDMEQGNPDLAPARLEHESPEQLTADDFPVDRNLADLAAQAEAEALSELNGDANGPEPLSHGVAEAADALFNEQPAAENMPASLPGVDAPLPPAEAPEAMDDSDEADELQENAAVRFQRSSMTGHPGDWPGFLAYCASELEIPPTVKSMISELQANWLEDALELTPPSNFLNRRLADPEVRKTLDALLRGFCGQVPSIRLMPVPETKSDRHKIREDVEALPIVQALKENMQAELIDCGPWYK